ncbi:unnamed protein product, partial [Tetraodon nigroviridis]
GVSDPGAHRGGQTEDPGLRRIHQLPDAGNHRPRGGTGSQPLTYRLSVCRCFHVRRAYMSVSFLRGSEVSTEATGARFSER